MPDLRCLLFDLGQVMFYLRVEKFWEALGGILNKDMDTLVARYADSGLQLEYETGRIGCDEFFIKLRELIDKPVGHDLLKEAWGSVLLPHGPNFQLVSALRAKYRTGVISNTNSAHISHVAPMWEACDPFDFCVYSHEVGIMKPEKGIYEKSLELAGCPADACAFFDDKIENVEAARELGMVSVQVPDPTSLAPALKGIGIAI